MKRINYTRVTPTHFNNDQAKGVAGRVVIGEKDGANNFCMHINEEHQIQNTGSKSIDSGVSLLLDSSEIMMPRGTKCSTKYSCFGD